MTQPVVEKTEKPEDEMARMLGANKGIAVGFRISKEHAERLELAWKKKHEGLPFVMGQALAYFSVIGLLQVEAGR